MNFQPSIADPLALLRPDPLRRLDDGVAKQDGVRLVRPSGLPHPSLAIWCRSDRSDR
jgi:hypothetical protein